MKKHTKSVTSVFDALRTTGDDDVHISSEDMKQLVDILGFVSEALRSGKLWFNRPGPTNKAHAEFCKRMAFKFSNIKIENEQ